MRVKRGASSNTFCGPAALSLLTGRHVDKCVQEVHFYRRRLRGHALLCEDLDCCNSVRYSVSSMDKSEITRVLVRMGYTINTAFHWELDKPKRKPTLVAFKRWLKRQPCWSPKKKYLVLVTGHYVVVKGIKLFDNANPDGVFFGKYNGRRRRVSQAWEVTRRAVCPVPSEPSR